MAFPIGFQADPSQSSAGSRVGTVNVILGETAFEDGLKVGKFAKFDNSQIENIDGSVTPVVAGIVLRKVNESIEAAGVIDSSKIKMVEVIRHGLCLIETLAGAAPVKFGTVYVSNQGDANDGLATETQVAGDEDSNAEFIQEYSTDLWLVRLK